MLKFIIFVTGFFKARFRFIAYIDTAIRVVNAIKKVVESPEAARFTQLTGFTWDEKLLEKLKGFLPGVLEALQLNGDCIAKPTLDELITCYAKYLASLSNSVRNAEFARVALMVARLLGVLLSDAELNALIQTRYVNLKNKTSLQ